MLATMYYNTHLLLKYGPKSDPKLAQNVPKARKTEKTEMAGPKWVRMTTEFFIIRFHLIISSVLFVVMPYFFKVLEYRPVPNGRGAVQVRRRVATSAEGPIDHIQVSKQFGFPHNNNNYIFQFVI